MKIGLPANENSQKKDFIGAAQTVNCVLRYV